MSLRKAKIKKSKDTHFFSGIHTWIASLAALLGITIVIWNTFISGRALLMTADYRVEHAELEGFKPIFKRFVFSLKLRNEGDGLVIVKDLILADSVFDGPDGIEKMPPKEQLIYLNKYWNCNHYSGVGTKNWVYGKDITEIEPGKSYSMTVNYDAIENFGSIDSTLPGHPICIVATLMDHFGVTHRIVEPIGEIKTGTGIQLETRAELMNYKLEFKKLFYLLPKSKCVEVFSTPYCIVI